jgi:hypothetical protein
MNTRTALFVCGWVAVIDGRSTTTTLLGALMCAVALAVSFSEFK